MRISDWSSDVCSSDLILAVLPIPLPDPIPDPIPGPDPAPFNVRSLRATARGIQQRKATFDLAATPPENLHEDYLALRAMPEDAASQYVLEIGRASWRTRGWKYV